MTTTLDVYADFIEEIAARLDLREPNRLALETVNAEIVKHYTLDQAGPPLEAVLDIATGVGKTYVMAAIMEFLVQAHGIADFVVITPGNAIQRKTINNFTVGHPKSFANVLSFDPFIVTAENFASPNVRAAMENDDVVKIYIFTVQSLLRPNSNMGRKVHKFQEGLGTEFYAHLQQLSQLTVFADEHHAYFGKAFAGAIADLHPWILLGLTATPHKQTPEEHLIYRYPLTAAIADRLVKTPVIVGRKDDLKDALTKLRDGATLLRAKQEALDGFTGTTKLPHVNAVMLVVAKTIAEADEYGSILRSAEFFNADYAGGVLVVHSSAPDDALDALASVEESDSPVRIIISVGMLKEGWDVKNVYVIASMRASVSEILTEQTLGRGMRLPFGQYTGIEMLDTLEVVAHERYEELLKKAGLLNQAFVDYRTRSTLDVTEGEVVFARRTDPVDATLFELSSEEFSGSALGNSTSFLRPPKQAGGGDVGLNVVPMETRSDQATQSIARLRQEISPKWDAPKIEFPVLKMSQISSGFSISDIVDVDVFRKLGQNLAADPEGELNRTLLGARVITGRDGLRRTEFVTSVGSDKFKSTPTLVPLDELRRNLEDVVLASPAVPARKSQRQALQPLLNAFLTGLGPTATTILSANLDRAATRLIKLIESEQRRYMTKPTYEEVVEVTPFHPTRVTDKEVSADRHGSFSRASAYEGWERSTFPVVWFDSSTERAVANIVDSDVSVKCWVRLHIGDLPILWSSGGQKYNPDLLVIENDSTHWVVEVKMDKEMSSSDVLGKREAARRWANHVTADEAVTNTWRYLLVSETDIATAKGSWKALKQLVSD